MAFSGKYSSFLKIIRPMNCLFAMFTTFLGFFYLNYYSQIDQETFSILRFPFSIIFACLSTFLIASGGYVINDVFDIEIDRVNKPKRPLPKGEMSLIQAHFYSLILFSYGFVMALFTRNIYCIYISLINSVSLYLYAKYYKKTFLIGNILVAWNACSTFIYGALISSNLKNILPLVCFSFFYTLIREWVKTIEDYEGDFKENVNSIAVVCGINKTLYFMMIPAFLMIASLIYFYQIGLINSFMNITLHLTITIPLILFFFILLGLCNKTKHNSITLIDDKFAKIQKYMKFNMILIVIVFVINHLLGKSDIMSAS